MKTRFFAAPLINPKSFIKNALLVITGLALLATASAKTEAVDARAKISDALLDLSVGQMPLMQKYDADGKKIDMPGKSQTQPSPDLITSSTYAFTASTGAALEDMSSGTTTLVGNNLDDSASGLTILPFDFWFDGVRANQFSVNANGEMRLGNTVVGTTFSNALASTTDAPKLAPYWDDLWVGFNGKIHYKTVGTAPNRKMVVEWQNMQVPRVANGSTGGATFQAWIYETTGVIEFVYGNGLVANSANSGYSVGIQAGVATNFAAVSTAANTVSYAAANDTQTNAIAAGTKYTFTPNAPVAPTGLNFTAVTGTSQTLNWTDNSSNEVGFLIYRSTDGVNYNFITQTAANATSSIQNNLGNNQTYSWRVVAVSEGVQSAALSGSQATITGAVSGTRSVGPTGTYASLTAAFADITTSGLSGNVILELQSAYLSSVETFPIVPSVNGSPSATITVRPASGATGLSIAGSGATALVDLSGSSFVTFDGRPGGTGSTRDMTISNTSTAGPTVRFINGASNNVLKFLILRSVNTTATTGVINFSTTTAVIGNNNNTIDNNDVRDGTTAPTNGITSTGTTTLGLENNNNTVSNNSIFNFFSATLDHNGILLGTGNTNWTISGNSFFNTNGTLNITGAGIVWQGIQFSSATGSWGHSVTGNFIGGTAASAGGGALTFTGVGVIRATRFTTGSQIPTSIQGNTISNFNLTSSSTSTGGAGLGMITGAFNAGDVTPNTVSNWTLNITGAGTLWRGISVGTGTAAVTVVSNNVVTNITNASTSIAQFQGIGIQGAAPAMTISGNTVGSTSTPDSISMSAAAVSFFGISSSATGAASYNFANNTIANATSTGTGAFNVVGMSISSGGYNIVGNTVRNLTSASTTTTSTIIGINATSTSSLNQFLSQNNIRSLNSTAPSAGVVLFGVVYSGPTTGASVVSRNKINSIVAATNSSLGDIEGIRISAGNATIQNNMIRLGFKDDATPTSITSGLAIGGIVETAGTNSVYHNTVYIGGTGVASASNTSAFISAVTTGTRALRDNVLANNRQNASGTATNTGALFTTALTLPNPVGLTMSHNVYFTSDPAASIRNGSAGTSYSVAGWQSASGIGASSVYSSLGQINLVNAEGTSAAVDLHVQSPTVIEQGGFDVGVLDDFDGQTRSGLTPVDIGADAGNFTGIDLSGPAISYTPLTGTVSTANRTLTATITDATAVASGANLPRIYFKKMSDMSYVSTQCSMTGGTAQNGTYSCTIDYSLVGGGGVAATDTVQYFVVAQDTVGNLGSNPGGATGANVNSITFGGTPNSYNILSSISGTKTVGAGGNYADLTDAISGPAGLNNSVITGPVTFLLTDASYRGGEAVEAAPVTINANSGSSSTNTVTFKPASGQTVSISGTSANALITLNGADWVIIDGSNTVGGTTRDLTIANTNTGIGSAVIWMQSNGADGATNNVVKNVNLVGTSVTATPGTLIGVGSGSSTISITSLGTGNNSNTFQNNNITKTVYGIYSGGASSANKNTGTVITQNVMNAASPNNITTGGIVVNFDNGVQVTQNDISVLKHDGTAGTTTTAFGIALGLVPNNTVTTFTGSDVINAQVRRNRINGITQLNSTGYSSFGIVVNTVTSGTTLVSNNMITGVRSFSTASDFSAGIVAGGGAGSTTQIYYNSVSMTGARGAASFPSYGLAIGGSNPTIDVRDNVFSNTQSSTSTGKMYAIGTISSAFTNMTSNYNDLFVSGTSTFVGQTGGLGTSGTDRTDLAAWIATTGTDTPNSISADPGFISSSDVHLSSQTSPAANAGTAIGVVTVDFDGNSRSATKPDIGADEIASNNLSALSLSMGSLTPAFDPATLAYTASVSNSVTSIMVTPTVLDSNATVTVNGTPVASGMSSGSIPLAVGDNTITVTVTPEFGPFAVEAGTPKSYIITVNRAAPPNFTLTYTAGANGSISGTSPQTVPQGGSGTAVTAVPNTGYHFVDWTDGVTTATRTDTNVMMNISVTANFAINTYTLTYTAGANGSITGTSPQMVNFGGSGSAVTAVPNTGYHFVDWTDGVTTASRTDTNVMMDINVTANFAINTYTLTYTAGANGTITGTSPQTVNFGGSGTAVTAVPNTGYHFVDWSDGVTTATRTDTNVMMNISVTANFAINTYTLTYTAGANGTITGTSPQTVNFGGSGTAVTAVPNTGYHFVDWSDGVTTATRTDSNVMMDISVTANFAINTYQLSVVAGTGGTITAPSTSPVTVNHGDATTITAAANSGFAFANWTVTTGTGSIANANNASTTITLTAGDATATANFTPTGNTNADLSNLVPSVGTLMPAFDPNTLSYTESVSSSTTSMTVTPTASDAGATIMVNGQPVTSGSPSQSITLNVGPNVITIKVTASDTTTMKTYTITVTRAGNVNVNPGAGTYATLKEAFDAINAGTHTGAVTVNIVGDTTETASATLNASGTGSASYNTVMITPNGARTVSGAIAAGSPLIDLAGADNVTIDGLNTGGNSLALSNTTVSNSAGTSTIRFINGASNNTVTNCSVLGSSTASVTTAGGNILISTSTGGANSGNTISNNLIGPAGANLPTKGVMSLGSTSPNNNTLNVVNNNFIYDFFNPTVGVAGISFQANTTTSTISNNRIFQTAPRTFTGTGLSYAGITCSIGTGQGTVAVTGNTIGFGASDGTGVTSISGSTNVFIGLNLTSSSTTVGSSIQGNTISGIVQSTASTSTGSSSAFRGIFLAAGRWDVGNVTGNQIGSLDGSSTITYTQSATGAFAAIYDFTSSSNTISNNRVGAITINGTGTGTGGFRGVVFNTASGATATLNNNRFGGSGAGAITDSLVGAYTMYVVQNSLGVLNATGNVIQNVSGNSNFASTIVVSGMLMTSTSTTGGPNIISQNVIHSLSNNSGAASNSIYALYAQFPATTANVVERNFVHSLNITSTAATSQLVGILPVAGSGTYKNNLVRLGLDAAGNSITDGFPIYGMFEIAGTNNIYANSVYVGGSGVASANATFAFVSNVSSGTRNYLDNIFWNARSNASGTGKNYAIAVGGTTLNPPGLTSNYNDLYATGTGSFVGLFNSVDQPTLVDWQAATGQDMNSISGDPFFVNPVGTAANLNLHLACGSPALDRGISIAGVTNDFDGDTRSMTTPDIGADEVTFVGPAAVSAVSRKTHDAAGDFDVTLPGIEPRSGGTNGDYRVVVTFATPVMVGSATVSSGTGSVAMASGSGTNTITVDLTGVANAQTLTLKLGCTDDGVNLGDVTVPLTVLLGDVNGSGTVTSSDVSNVKGEAGQPVTMSNFRADVIANGNINTSDIGQTKVQVGINLPPFLP